MDSGFLRFLTRDFCSLQGLRIVPVGVLLVGWSVVEPVWRKSNLRDSFKLVLVVAALAGWMMAGRYYENRFGRVKQDGGLRGAAVALVVLIAWLAALKSDEMHPPFSLGAAFLACCSAGVAIWSRGRRWHFIVPAAAFIALSVAPMAGIGTVTAVDGLPSTITLGLSIIFTGVLDHLLLVRSLPEPSDV